jgi:cell filamentation protein
MIFDPFGDYEERGYLRNKFGEKDQEIIKHLEHSSFVVGVAETFKYLSGIPNLSYRDVLETHNILFKDIYPWAGQDRSQTAPRIAIGKGDVLFAHPEDTKRSVEYALGAGQDKLLMAKQPGHVMGYLAYGHPFLDGNGRTIMVIHTELAERAGISINWASISKNDYLMALTKEINNPNDGILDSYLFKFIAEPLGKERLVGHISDIRGLRGGGGAEPIVAGQLTDPLIQKRYKMLQKQRRGHRGLGEP